LLIKSKNEIMGLTSNIRISSIDVNDFVQDPDKANQVALRWLGQAGFQILYKDFNLMIDPYLSDFLAEKYDGKEFSHVRMMPCPINTKEVKNLNWVLCTHRHSDHMDPGALPILLKNNPQCRIIAPKAEKKHVLDIGVNEAQSLFVNATDSIELSSDILLEVIPSSHEDLKINEQGHYHYLGYILKFGDTVLYHSGDSIPFVGLEQELKKKGVDIALLPVNGRDEYRQSKGAPGNFTFDEAIELCDNAEIRFMICHHFGMFDFNTADRGILKKNAKTAGDDQVKCIVPDVGCVYRIITLNG